MDWKSTKGTEWLDTMAHRRFEDATGITLSYALTNWCCECETIDCGKETFPWYSWRQMTPEEYQERLEESARFSGWMEALTRRRNPEEEIDPEDFGTIRFLKGFVHYGVLRVIAAGNCGRALNSPYNRYLPRWLFQHYPSPGRLERIVWRVRRKAEAILEDYGFPMRPSWTHLGMVLCKQHNPKRAARVLAAMTMTVRKSATTSFDEVPTWRKAREILVRLASCKLPIEIPDDGRREAKPLGEEGDFRVYRARREEATIWSEMLWVEGSHAGFWAESREQELMWLLKLRAAAADAGFDPADVQSQHHNRGGITFVVSSPDSIRPPGYMGFIHNGTLVPHERFYEGYRIDASCIIAGYVPRYGLMVLDGARTVYVRPDTTPEELIEYLGETFMA